MKEILVFFCSSQRRLSLLRAQVNDKCPDSSHWPLKRNCSTKWIENYDVVLVFKEFYPAVVGSLDELSRSRDRPAQWCSGESVRFVVGRTGVYSLSRVIPKDFKNGIHSFPAWRSA